MSARDNLADAQPTLTRIGTALDRIGVAGWPALHAALAGYTRERRGRLTATALPHDVAHDLMHLADEVERLADALDHSDAA